MKPQVQPRHKPHKLYLHNSVLKEASSVPCEERKPEVFWNKEIPQNQVNIALPVKINILLLGLKHQELFFLQ